MDDPDTQGVAVDSQLTRLTLIRGAAAGNREDRARFARNYLPVARAYIAGAWRSNDWGVHMEDAVQEVFVQCFRKDGALERFDSAQPGGFRAFFFGVIRNVMRRYDRELATEGGRAIDDKSALLNSLPSHDDTISVAFDRAWARSMIDLARELMQQRALLAGFEARQRMEVLRLRFEENQPVRVIASLLGLEIEAIHQAYRRARREFKTCLRQTVSEQSTDGTVDVDARCSRLLRSLCQA